MCTANEDLTRLAGRGGAGLAGNHDVAAEQRAADRCHAGTLDVRRRVKKRWRLIATPRCFGETIEHADLRPECVERLLERLRRHGGCADIDAAQCAERTQ